MSKVCIQYSCCVFSREGQTRQVAAAHAHPRASVGESITSIYFALDRHDKPQASGLTPFIMLAVRLV